MRLAEFPLWKVLAGLLVLLGGELFASNAQAGCGDHVVRGDEPTATQPVPIAPCTGPQCTSSDELPAPPPAPAPRAPESWACLFSPPRLDGTGRPARVRPKAALPFTGHASSIYHPPRPCC